MSMAEGIYVFVGFRSDGSSAAVDLKHCSGAAEALDWADKFLRLHASCTAAEVWMNGTLTHLIGSPDTLALLRPSQG
jgi:hypothetical protein